MPAALSLSHVGITVSDLDAAPVSRADRRAGPWHIAVTDPDIEALASSIEKNGGRVLSPVHPLVDGTSFRICMCVDPFGVTHRGLQPSDRGDPAGDGSVNRPTYDRITA